MVNGRPGRNLSYHDHLIRYSDRLQKRTKRTSITKSTVIFGL